MIEVVGYIGTVLFSICAIPQVLKSYKEKHSDGISLLFLLLWLGGEIFHTAYDILRESYSSPLLINYAFNIVLIVIILYYKIFPTRYYREYGNIEVELNSKPTWAD